MAYATVNNYIGYQNAEDIAQLKEAITEALASQREMLDLDESAMAMHSSIEADVAENLTAYTYRGSSLIKIVGFLVGLIGSVLLRRKKRAGIHLFFSGMAFSLGGVFYWHGASFVGWAMAIPILFLVLVVGFFIYRKRTSFS